MKNKILACLMILALSLSVLTLGVLGEDSSTNTRFLIYQEFWPLLRDRWLTGVGLGTDATFFSVVPDNSLGKSAVRALRSNDVWTGKHYAYFSNTACEYYPCHPDADPDNFNCLFCYCPLYMLGRECTDQRL